MDSKTITLIARRGKSIISFLFLKPRMATYLLIFFCVFDLGFFSRWFGATRTIARFPYFLSILLCIKLCIDYFSFKISAPRNIKPLKIILRFIAILIFISVISLFYSNQSIAMVIFELRYYFLLLVLYLSIYYYLPLPMEDEMVIKSLVILGLIQIPFTAIQYSAVMFWDVHLSTSPLDFSSGTFSNYTALVFLQCVNIGLVLLYQLRRNHPLLILNNYFLILLLMVPLLLSNSRSAMGLVLVLSMSVILRQAYVKRDFVFFLRSFALMIFLSIATFALFYFLFYRIHGFDEQLNIGYIVEYFFRPHDTEDYNYRMARGTSILVAIKLISKSFTTMIFGVGSGSFSETSLLGVRGQHLQEFGLLAGLERMQISKTLVEYGLMGIINFFIFFLCIFKHAKMVAKYYSESLLLDIYIVILISILLLFFYAPVFNANIVLLVIAYYIAFSHYNLNRMEQNTKDIIS